MKALQFALLKRNLSEGITFIPKAVRRYWRRKSLCLKLSRELEISLSSDELNVILRSSRSQLGQDVFAYLSSGRRRDGFFVEFGAGDGMHLSNTVMLEREFDWAGILAEPLSDYHAAIMQQRSAVLDTRCVWRSSGETLNFVGVGYLSTINQFRASDHHASSRASGHISSVETVSLWDLLEQHGAPSTIDFLSIDTEGSEYEILRAFPFGKKYSIRAIACEHNFSSNRDLIHDLLLEAGYRRVASSHSAHDDWFVLSQAPDGLTGTARRPAG